MQIFKKRAFTLAEVLVTLGIIGVVSAMTIPTLMRNHQRLVYVTQLKKVYSMLSQAVDNALQKENLVSLDESNYQYTNPNGAESFLTRYLKVVNNCKATLTPCFAEKYRTLDGENFILGTPEVAVTLADGTSINVIWNGLEYDSGSDPDHGYLALQVDINGQEGPNVVGRDLFYMELYSDGKVSEGYHLKERAENSCGDNWGGYGGGCLTQIINAGWKMDY